MFVFLFMCHHLELLKILISYIVICGHLRLFVFQDLNTIRLSSTIAHITYGRSPYGLSLTRFLP
jgi:hypothetical protein